MQRLFILIGERGSLEDLALVEGAAALICAGPREVLLHKLLGLRGGGVELAPVVRLVVDLPVGRQREGQVVATPHPHARDSGVVVGAEQARRRERLFAHFVQPLVHACDIQATSDRLVLQNEPVFN